MLVLSRKKDEEILIDGRISVKVVRVRGNKVQIGIEAPREMAIHRRELTVGVDATAGGATGVCVDVGGSSCS